MQFDFDELPAAVAYKVLGATVTPRPIAWVVSQNEGGQVNAAPFSFFNVMGSNPPTLAIGIQADDAGGLKDTVRNLIETGEFVVNLVPEYLVEAMNITAVDAPSGINELDLARLTTHASHHVAPPRIAQSPVAFECRTVQIVETGPCQNIVIARVLAAHVADEYVLNAERGHIDTLGLKLVGRCHGSDYVRTQDVFQLARPNWASWRQPAPTDEGP